MKKEKIIKKMINNGWNEQSANEAYLFLFEEFQKIFDKTIIEYQVEISNSKNPFIPSKEDRYLIKKLNFFAKRFMNKIKKS